MHDRELHDREMREMHDREMHEREMHEREMHERERHEHGRQLELEIQETELRRRQIDLHHAELEMDQAAQSRLTHRDELSIEGIEIASRYMETPEAAEFLAGLIDDVPSPMVRAHLRIKVAELMFQSKRPDQAREQLRLLIAP